MRLNASDKAGSYKYDLKKLHSNRSALVSIIYCELICTTLILVYALLTSTIPGANPGSKCPFWREENQWQQLVCHRRFLLALSRFIVEFHPSESTSHASNHNFLSVTQNEYDCVKFNYSSTSRNGPSGVVLPGFSWRWWWRELLSHRRLFPYFHVASSSFSTFTITALSLRPLLHVLRNNRELILCILGDQWRVLVMVTGC